MIFLVTAVSAAVISLLASLAAGHLFGEIPIAGSFIRLTLSKNPGIAFGILLPSPWQEILILTAFVMICVVATCSTLTTTSSIGFGLVIGGALANLADRFADGVVPDFIAIGTFPVFNVADACISVGAGLLLLEWWSERKKRHP